MSEFKNFLKKQPKEILVAMVADFCKNDLARKMSAADSAVRYCDHVIEGIDEKIKMTNSRSSSLIDMNADKDFWKKHRVRAKQQESTLMKKAKR